MHRDRPSGSMMAAAPGQEQLQYYSIGEFYKDIEAGLRYLDARDEPLFTGDPARQVGPEYYYSGGGDVVPVTDLETALAALDLIAEQGEGLGGTIHDADNELAHYYRFQQLLEGRYYQPGDQPDHPTGPELAVDWDAVYPVKTDVRLADLPQGSELHAAAVAFNADYADFLGLLTRAFTGEPELLVEAVTGMFRLRDGMSALMHNPIPGLDGVHAGPTFEVAAVPGRVAA